MSILMVLLLHVVFS